MADEVAELRIQPVARRRALLHRDHLDPLAVLQRRVQRHHRAVDLRAAAAMAQTGVNLVGEVHRRRSPGQVDDLALRREHINRVFEQAGLELLQPFAGAGDVLGACRVRLNAVDQLLLGSMIRETAEAQAYADWKLRDADEPEFAREGPGAGQAANPGSESVMIGKAAPDFELDMLDGKRFKLSEQKGKVIVLDFWASWCGFCMQSMPEVHKLMQEFKGRDVQYITVNAQEDQATIKSALERLKIEPVTVLDIDGAAGEKYQATSLPQIVVIDTEMKVADMIIGANPDLIDQLRTAVQKSLDAKKPK